MSDHAKKIVSGIIILLVFVVCVALVVIGQKHIGPQGLGLMLLGLAGLVVLLWLYNRQYQ